MEIDKIFGIFNSLVAPVASYGCPVWLPTIIPKKYFEKCDIFQNSNVKLCNKNVQE